MIIYFGEDKLQTY